MHDVFVFLNMLTEQKFKYRQRIQNNKTISTCFVSGCVNKKFNGFSTGPPLVELTLRIVNTTGYKAFLFHFVVSEGACCLIMFTYYLGPQRSATVRAIYYSLGFSIFDEK